MKKIIFLLSLVLMITVCSAQVKLQTNKEGAYQIQPDSLEWVDPGFTASPEALNYSSSFNEAISNPGEKILVEDSVKTLKLKLLFKKQIEINKSYIVYNNKTNNIDHVKASPIKKEESSYLILFFVLSILLLMTSNILFKKGYNFLATTLAVISIIIAVAILLLSSGAPIFSIISSAFILIFPAVSFVIFFRKNYKILLIVLYIYLAILIVIPFIAK